MLNPDLLLYAYRTGLFPMADPDEDDQIYWYAPDPRALMPPDAFHVPPNTAKRVRQQVFVVTVDEDLQATIRACAPPPPGRRCLPLPGPLSFPRCFTEDTET